MSPVGNVFGGPPGLPILQKLKSALGVPSIKSPKNTVE